MIETNRFKKVAIFASGTGSNFDEIYKHWLKDKNPNFEITFLFCDKPDAPVIEKANKNLVLTYVFELKDFDSKESFEDEILKILETNDIDIIVLAGYMKLIGKKLLKKYNNRIINIHPSLLPKYKGANAITDFYADYSKNNKLTTGITMHLIDDKVDEGKVISQIVLNIDKKLSLDELTKKIHELEHSHFYNAIKNYIANFFNNY